MWVGRWWLAAAALLHVLPWAARPALIGGDEPHYALMARSLAVDRDLDLSADYARVETGSREAGRKMAGGTGDRHLVERHGRRVFSHPLGLPLLAAPVVGLVAAVSPEAPPDVPLGLLGLVVTFLALLAGADLLGRLAGDRRAGALLASILYFTTPLWFYSRTFYTEPYTWALAVLAAWLLSRQRWLAGSLLLGAVPLLKETGVLLVIPVLLWILRARGPRRAALAALGPAIAALAWLAKNLALFGEPFVTFQPFFWGRPLEGVLALLVGPNLGLLWFAPVAVPAIAGATVELVRGERPSIAAHGLLAFALYFGVTACWYDPAGGYAWGHRLLVPALPALAPGLAAAWGRWRNERWLAPLLAVCAVAGFTAQWTAALAPFRAFWGPAAAQLLAARPLQAATGALLALAALWAARAVLVPPGPVTGRSRVGFGRTDPP